MADSCVRSRAWVRVIPMGGFERRPRRWGRAEAAGDAQPWDVDYPDRMLDSMIGLNTALEGRYRIERALGEGGMATVYLAQDIKHERKVALKVLKPELAAVVGADRFLAEIKTTANLQHPHILPLFDSGEADSYLFYVMPYVEGETLGDRLSREHQLPVADAVQITKDVAEALAYAHGQGVVHRDIKPANILIHAGRPVVSDFGIALALGVAGGGRLTDTGLSLGTPHYMSPEQATGDALVGPATDVYALGCVLYEMLVGEPPYTGSTAQAVLGKIITESPPQTSRHRRTVPAHVEAAVNKALEKVPADRFRGATDFAQALGDPGFRHGDLAAAGVAANQALWKRLALVMTVATTLFAFAFVWLLLRPEPPALVFKFADPFEEGQTPSAFPAFTSDGSALVYASGEESPQLWIRRWADLEATPIRGTEGAVQFALSPDDQEVVFIESGIGGSLRIVGLDGGQLRTVVQAVDTLPWTIMGLDWGSDGMIYFARGGVGIQRVPATGGEPETVTNDPAHFFPHVLPDGRGLLVLTASLPGFADGRIAVVGLEGGEARELFPGLRAKYAPTGHIVSFSGAGTLEARRFDLERLAVTGAPILLVEDAGDPMPGVLQWSLSETGSLLYATGFTTRPDDVEFVWVTRSGEATPAVPGHTFVAPSELPTRPTMRLAPDGRRVAYSAVVEGNADIYVMAFDNGVSRRLTIRAGFDDHPIWFPDGRRLAFVGGTTETVGALDESGEQPDFHVWVQRADGTGEAEEVIGGRLYARDVTPDGETLILYRGARPEESPGQRNIFTFRPGEDSEPVPLQATEEYQELSPALSPNGRWLAYVSDEAGQREVIVRPFPDVAAGRWVVSTGGGMAPMWAHNGEELFYFQPSQGQGEGRGRIMSVEYAETNSVFQPGPGRPLFDLGSEYEFNRLDPFYDVAPDDQRFLFARVVGLEEAEERQRFVLVQNVFELLKQRTPD